MELLLPVVPKDVEPELVEWPVEPELVEPVPVLMLPAPVPLPEVPAVLLPDNPLLDVLPPVPELVLVCMELSRT